MEPEASFAEVQALGSQQGESLAVSAQTLRKRLDERHLLITTGKQTEKRETLMIRQSIEGQRRNVLHLHVQSLTRSRPEEAPADPVPPEEVPAQPPPPQKDTVTPWSGNGHGPAPVEPMMMSGDAEPVAARPKSPPVTFGQPKPIEEVDV